MKRALLFIFLFACLCGAEQFTRMYRTFVICTNDSDASCYIEGTNIPVILNYGNDAGVIYFPQSTDGVKLTPFGVKDTSTNERGVLNQTNSFVDNGGGIGTYLFWGSGLFIGYNDGARALFLQCDTSSICDCYSFKNWCKDHID